MISSSCQEPNGSFLQWANIAHKSVALLAVFLYCRCLFCGDLIISRCVPNWENEKSQVSDQVSVAQAGKPDPQLCAWASETTAVHTLLQRHCVSIPNIIVSAISNTEKKIDFCSFAT